MDPAHELISKCLQKDQQAQEAMYRLYAPKLYGVCLRYARNHDEAQDILQEGFIKIFTFLKDYRHEGSFEGWMRRTIVNTAINFFKRKSKELVESDIDGFENSSAVDANIIENISANDLMKVIQELPEGYRMVFNLYILEGYSHREISGMLNISESTSKSQLSRARHTLQTIIIQRKLL